MLPVGKSGAPYLVGTPSRIQTKHCPPPWYSVAPTLHLFESKVSKVKYIINTSNSGVELCDTYPIFACASVALIRISLAFRVSLGSACLTEPTNVSFRFHFELRIPSSSREKKEGTYSASDITGQDELLVWRGGDVNATCDIVRVGDAINFGEGAFNGPRIVATDPRGRIGMFFEVPLHLTTDAVISDAELRRPGGVQTSLHDCTLQILSNPPIRVPIVGSLAFCRLHLDSPCGAVGGLACTLVYAEEYSE